MTSTTSSTTTTTTTVKEIGEVKKSGGVFVFMTPEVVSYFIGESLCVVLSNCLTKVCWF